MRAGQLDRQITVYRNVGTQESTYGTITPQWEPLIALPGSPLVGERFPARVEEVSPSRLESVLADAVRVGRHQVRVMIRWRNDIRSTMRIILHGETDRTYNIIGGPSEIGLRKEAIEFLCEEVTTDG